MRFLSRLAFASLLVIVAGCHDRLDSGSASLQTQLAGVSQIVGNSAYLASPFLAAGDRVYGVGFQDGSFPALGWHLPGEMGGIWDHPIKLLDGFDAAVSLSGDNETYCLDKADRFTNYPVGNKHHFTWRGKNVEVERFQFAPDGEEGLVVEFLFRNHGAATRKFKFIFQGNFDLRPVWLGERTGMLDDADEVQFLSEEKVLVARDKSNPWFAVVGSSVSPVLFNTAPVVCSKAAAPGARASLTFEVSVEAGAQAVIPVFIAGSYQSETGAMATFSRLRAGASAMLARKIARYDSIRYTVAVTVPDTTLQRMLEWVKYSTDWLVREVPEIGRGLSAGSPDYPWWFGCDSEYALQGVLATGQHALAKSTILLLKRISDKTNGNGRIIHEASTNGAVYNPGNTNETAQFVSLLWTYYQWTGDRALMEALYPDVTKAMRWLLADMDPDHNLFPNGAGMVEIRGLDSEMIDVAVYTQQALEAASKLAALMNDQSGEKTWREQSITLKKLINSVWWVEEDNSFADFISTREKALDLIRAAIIRADTLDKKWASQELRTKRHRLEGSKPAASRGYTIFHNAVVNAPMEVGIADPDKAQRALNTARNYRNYFGAYVTGIDRGEADVDSLVERARKKTFNYTGAVMTLPTGVLAIAEARYGHPDKAMEYLRRLEHTFSYALPGSMYEVSPDFGMMAQAWNVYAVAVPVIVHFFGVEPAAADKTVHLSPSLPSAWKQASLLNLPVGNNHVSLSIDIREGLTAYTLTQTEADWQLKLRVRPTDQVVVNGEKKSSERVGQVDVVTMKNGTSFVVEVRAPK